MAEVYFIAHALGYHKDFNIEKYFTKISKISYKFSMTDKKNVRNYHKSWKYIHNLKIYKPHNL